MTERLNPETRIALGVDDDWRQKITEIWTHGDDAVDPDWPDEVKDLLDNYEQTASQIIDHQTQLATQIRADILGEPYVEEGEIYDAIWGRFDKGQANPETRHMNVVRQLGGRTISMVDHGTLLYPTFQFMRRGTFTPYPVVHAVNAIFGDPHLGNSWGTVSWWRQPSGYLPGEDRTSYRAPRDLLIHSQEHMKIVKIALANRFQD